MLREAGLISIDVDAAVATGLSSVFFPHGIGHLLGLQVHDVAGLAASPEGGERPRPEGHPFLRLTRTLEPGYVVTIEPGIYFIDMLLERARAGDHARHVDWAAVERAQALRRHPHRGRRGLHVRHAGEPHARRVRRARVRSVARLLAQLPISPPSSRVITIVDERGRPPAAPSGQLL